MSEQDSDLLQEIDRLIVSLESHPDPAVRTQVTALLEGIDAIHRTALTHLVNAIRGMAGDAFINRLTADPAIRLLLMSYELLAVDRRLLTEEALDAVRGHLHAHGIEVELLDVVGGAVYVRLHGLERSTVPIEGVRHDLEEALRSGLLGFQELVLEDRQSAAPPAGLVQMGSLRRAHRPVYRRVLAVSEVPAGEMKAIDVDGQPVLIANVDGEFYAVANRCGESPLPLEFGVLQGAELRCSWHGCRYDIRSGIRLDNQLPGAERQVSHRLAVFPVAVEEGQIRVAVGVEPAGDSPREGASREAAARDGPTAGTA
ncbi:MAG: Rieske 2Fe-2S domain-containing protein [Chloroflexota bacterium]|nr:Rieske 2Fe-2S domain-containing protein [Chloroflexota bacterium]